MDLAAASFTKDPIDREGLATKQKKRGSAAFKVQNGERVILCTMKKGCEILCPMEKVLRVKGVLFYFIFFPMTGGKLKLGENISLEYFHLTASDICHLALGWGVILDQEWS